MVSAVSSFIGFSATLRSGECDLVEDELGNWVGEGRGNWEPVRFGFVSSGISDVSEVEVTAIGESEADGTLGFDGTIGTTSVSGGRGLDSSLGLGIGTEFSGSRWVDTVVTDDGLYGVISVGGLGWGIASVGSSKGYSQEAGEDDLKYKNFSSET